MKQINIFNKKHIAILNPFYLENLWHIQSLFKSIDNKIEFNNLKSLTIFTLKHLLDKELIYVLEPNFMENKEFNRIDLSNGEIISKVKKNWKENISEDDLYNLAWFKYQNWYKNKLSNLGLTAYTINWKNFVEEKIGNLEKWIEENRPKE